MDEEEIIKIIKEKILIDFNCYNPIDKIELQAIQGLLDLYNKQKEINQYNDKEIKYLNCCIKSYEDNYIDKDKIKEKIKEYSNTGITINVANRSAGKTFVQAVNNEVTKVLKELLEEENK